MSSGTHTPSSSAANGSNNNPTGQQGNEAHNEHKPVLTLPAPGDVSETINQLEVNGQDIKLDILGPVVVNEDGTMSRIDNWHEMAEIEKANVRRILLKRNAQRLTRLRAAAAEQEAGSAGTTGSVGEK
ncbi:hypothetical protein BC939DRAFT_500857 [Gamsiella multidivaricata]|uniref:uncharacterized protein n=1 Tax=Gamsiella multidivaricata TaxID=101098 RepID=UPI0022204B4A|nr:uncharacterized protein BC939DRAFT_500857 [Gamsiella multidivaricata]KAG0371056.1 hypothetical protein BGZ54_000974 [Gamsiella multidivaricata]KAI7828197.1 hypothetical protein BC939DRAFT_500857 [Gamsiella multidivaricata]